MALSCSVLPSLPPTPSFSQEGWSFSTPDLPHGQYRMQGWTHTPRMLQTPVHAEDLQQRPEEKPSLPPPFLLSY